MNQKVIKIKEIENWLSRKIMDIYKYQLKHQLTNISYKLLDHNLIVFLKGTITSPEKLLKKNNSSYLAKQVREVIDSAIRPQIKRVIEEVLDVKVVDFLSDTTIDHDLTGAIAIFEFKPNNISKYYKS